MGLGKDPQLPPDLEIPFEVRWRTFKRVNGVNYLVIFILFLHYSFAPPRFHVLVHLYYPFGEQTFFVLFNFLLFHVISVIYVIMDTDKVIDYPTLTSIWVVWDKLASIAGYLHHQSLRSLHNPEVQLNVLKLVS